MKTLGAQDPPAYYIGYPLTETQRATVSGSNGALLSSDEGPQSLAGIIGAHGKLSTLMTRTRWMDGSRPTGARDQRATGRRSGSIAAGDLG